MCFWVWLKIKMALFWWSSCTIHCSIWAVLSSRFLRLLEVTQVYGCQQLCNTKPWLCTQANYCWSQRELDCFLPESAWAAAEWILRAEPFAWVLLFSILNVEIEAEQKLSSLPETEQRGGKRWLPRYIHQLADSSVPPSCIARKINYLMKWFWKDFF